MQKVKRFFRSIQFKIPVLFIFMLMISLQLIVANFLRQLETQMISNFQEQIQLQVGFLKNSVQPILARDDKDEVKIAEISKILQDYPTGSSIVEARIMDTQGYILGTTNQSQQSVVGTRTTEADAQQVLLTNDVYAYNYTEHENRYWKIVSPISPISGNSGNPLGIISVTTNIESRYTQVKDIGVIFVSSSLIAIVLVIIITFLISQGITKPIAEMKKQTEKIAEGNYTGEVKIYSDDELGQLGQAINDLSLKIKEAQESTESERQRLDSVLRHMSDGVIATDRRGRIVIMNTAALDILNLKSEKVIGIPLLEILPLEERVTFRELLETQQERLIYLEEDGEDSMIQCEFSVIQRESGFISGLVCVLTDVTEQQKIERERRNFVSNVSHELRTPLTSIKSYTEALVDGAWENKEIAPGFLNVIETETDRMMRMITDLLNLSRMDQNRFGLEKEFINMNELVVHIVNRFEMVLQSEPYRDKNYRILTDITQRDLWVETHTDIIVSVSDEGLGIARKDIPHLFDRFYRVDKARSRAMGGSGLGLAIAQEVVQLHGGKIWVNSIENKGSTFFVSLPYIPFEEDGEWE